MYTFFIIANEIKISLYKRENLFSKLDKKRCEVSRQLRNLSSRTSSFENRVNLIENSLSNVDPSDSSGEAIPEVFNRQSRSSNLILCNASESDDNTSKKTRH